MRSPNSFWKEMRYTPRAGTAFKLADVEAKSLGHSCVSSEHLVLGLLLLGNGVQFSVLAELGFTADAVRQRLKANQPAVKQFKNIGGIKFGLSAQAALERASHEAVAMSHSYAGTEHILLGLLAEDHGGAADLFALQNVDKVKTRQKILKECRAA